MEIGVMGAGAVGCYYGALLALAGHEVRLIARTSHAEAIARQGLRLERQGVSVHVGMLASTSPAALQGAALILFCVKSSDTENAGAALAPFVAPGAVVLSLQNGVDNAERLAATLGREVTPAAVYVAAEMAGPGHIRHHGRGELVLGASPQKAVLAALFNAAMIPTTVSDNVAGELWAKLIVNCAYNALSAITRQPYGKLVLREGISEVIEDVVTECLSLTDQLKIAIPGDIRAAVRRIAETMPGQLSSTAQDLARGKASEIDYLNGYVVRRGRELGLAMPVNRVLHTMVKALEADGGPAVHGPGALV